MAALDVRTTTPPCAGTDSWFCGEYFTLENTAILFIRVCGTMACLYIMVITITFRWDDLFRRFTLHLYIPFVPYSITELLFIACGYTSYFGPPIIDIGRFSPLTLVTRYFRFVIAFQYRVFINSIMFVTFLCIVSPMKYRKLLCHRDLLRNFIFGHIFVNVLAGLSLFVVCREWSPTEDPAFIYTLSVVAFYFVEGANVTLSFLTFLSFIMAVVVMIVCRRKVAPNAVRANAVGNRKRLVTLVIYSTPPTIANMTSIVGSVCECWYQLSEGNFAAMQGNNICNTTYVLDEYFIMEFRRYCESQEQKERVCGFLFLCGHVFANLLALCSVVCVSQLWPVKPNGQLMNNAIKFIYYFVQTAEVILNMLTSISFLMCRSIVLTICTIFAFKQYRDATVSILRCSNKTKRSPCKAQTIITKPPPRRSMIFTLRSYT
ncbi:hypothetical protein Tcan_09926 [Toxocara canis]|uniref:Uncharacterized protein n=1 Tax=Toxocara canis TaxID=6265 RepID=A0A0B2V4H4_TOXCA|nr:hypothetical protein Tcan_09926 [Toxocara canis]